MNRFVIPLMLLLTLLVSASLFMIIKQARKINALQEEISQMSIIINSMDGEVSRMGETLSDVEDGVNSIWQSIP